MDDSRYRIRGMEDTDYDTEARLWNVLGSGGRIISAEELRQGDRAIAQPPMVCVKRVIEERGTGQPVGFGHLGSAPDSFHPRKFWVGIGIDPDHQGRGLGRALADELEREATRREAVALWTAAREDSERGMRFWPQRGFTEKRRFWDSCLELADANPPADRSETLARDGITFTTLADEGAEDPGVFRAVCESSVAAMADAPRSDPFSPEIFQRFVESYLRGPRTIPDAMFLAQRAGQFVGVCLFQATDAEPDALHQTFTGTLPAVRGLGVASELKRRSLEYGRSHGYRVFRTSNDSTNRAMWSINERLGYRRERVWVECEKLLSPELPAPPSG